MRRSTICVVVAVVLTACGGLLSVAADKKKPKPKPFKATCPVKGEPAEQDAFILVGGRKVYFCCQSCPFVFDLANDIERVRVNRQFLETGQIVQIACPLTGHDLKPGVTIDVGGVKVTLCCPGCQAKLNKLKGDKRIDAVFGKITRGFTFQVKCPVSGKPIKPRHVVKYKKQAVFFCCPKCPKAFEANPKKFVSKLPQLRKKKKK